MKKVAIKLDFNSIGFVEGSLKPLAITGPKTKDNKLPSARRQVRFESPFI